MPPPAPAHLANTLLSVIETSIVPLTRAGVASGSKVFGAAILDAATLEVLVVATNDERTSPLLHGEVNCIQKYFVEYLPSLPSSTKTDTTDPKSGSDPSRCILLATHEPCSLCLSAIAWSGFPTVHHLFTYDDSRRLFSIPHDIDISEAVFRVPSVCPGETDEHRAQRALYNRRNRFFTVTSLAELAGQADGEDESRELEERIARVKGLYRSLDETYQEAKASGVATSSIWK